MVFDHELVISFWGPVDRGNASHGEETVGVMPQMVVLRGLLVAVPHPIPLLRNLCHAPGMGLLDLSLHRLVHGITLQLRKIASRHFRVNRALILPLGADLAELALQHFRYHRNLRVTLQNRCALGLLEAGSVFDFVVSLASLDGECGILAHAVQWQLGQPALDLVVSPPKADVQGSQDFPFVTQVDFVSPVKEVLLVKHVRLRVERVGRDKRTPDLPHAFEGDTTFARALRDFHHLGLFPAAILRGSGDEFAPSETHFDLELLCPAEEPLGLYVLHTMHCDAYDERFELVVASPQQKPRATPASTAIAPPAAASGGQCLVEHHAQGTSANASRQRWQCRQFKKRKEEREK
mmetsp:Transcript_20268/g.56285  ORF Transcript_20268/g.56285 Transcript_20268/m.56285 type:complete len:350 (+) Transcript_20268:359-1408(+)